MKLLLLVSLILLLGACTFSIFVTPDNVIAIFKRGESDATPTQAPALPTPTIEVTAVLPQHFACITLNYANVRQTPSLTGKIMGSVPIGKEVVWYNRSGVGAVEYDERGNAWNAISYGTLDGFIFSALLSCEE